MKKIRYHRIFGLVVLLAATALKAQTPFPFNDGAEDSAATQARWSFDPETLWTVNAVRPHSGSQSWESIVPTASNPVRYLTLTAPIDLSSSVNPIVSFWAAIDGSGGSYFWLEASNNGGTTWQNIIPSTVVQVQDWVQLQGSLASYRTPNILLRLAVQRWSQLPRAFIDDILIDDAPLPGSISLTQPTNHGFRLVWSRSTAADFGRYLIVMDTTPTGTLDRITGSSVINRRERRLIEITDKATTELELTDLTFVNTSYTARIFEQDAQTLWNLGSAAVSEETALQADIEVAPFSQDFEGPVNWAADLPWRITNAANGENGHSSSLAWEDSPFGSESANYVPNAQRRMIATIDFSTIHRPVLRFNHRYTFEGNSQAWGGLYFSVDSDNWTLLHAYYGSQAVWDTEEFDIGFLRGRDPGYIMFQLTSNSSTVVRDGWHLDDIEVYNEPSNYTFPFEDTIDTEASTLARWIPGGWHLQPTNSVSGELAWGFIGTIQNQPQYLSLKGSIDLSISNSPRITYWAKVDGAGGNYIWVEASGDGGKTWEQLGQRDIVRSEEWIQLEQSLDVLRVEEVSIRFGSQRWSQVPRLLLDDIQIDNTPTALGDVNGDAVIDLGDAIIILRHLTGFITLGGNSALAADVSGNGTLSAFDAVLILQFVAGLIDFFPAESFKLIASAGAVDLNNNTNAAGTLTWGPPLAGTAPGTYQVPLILNADARHITALHLTLPLDSSQSIDSITDALPPGWHRMDRVTPNGLELVFIGTQALPPGPIAQLHLSAPLTDLHLAGTAVLNENLPQVLTPLAVNTLPQTFSLAQNIPNPFNPTTQIQFNLPSAQSIELTIYNLLGQTVRTLATGHHSAGTHRILWDGRDHAGRAVESGLYLYRLQSPGFVQTRKMVLLQ